MHAGEPKAIVWTHITPVRCAVDAWAHMDVQRRDVMAWPTNLGWMMGPFLVFAALLNGAAIALFQVQPLGFLYHEHLIFLGLASSSKALSWAAKQRHHLTVPKGL